ncbi:hypothetical protein WR25_19126 [Diploscapter pachys]|uniref:ATP-dependent RNA helicase n=1 Tax=Diploscapter pachys TaxID=2018661 RepID=A0A2A2L337_9BILA|nr:hypothetical protein WR25_19126 [Diploscapter pachys]
MGKEATKGQKQIHEQNKETIKFYGLAAGVSALLYLFSTQFLSNFTTSAYVCFGISASIQLFTLLFMKKISSAHFDERGNVADAGGDLNDPSALGEYCKDAIILAVITQIVALYSNYGFLILLAFPLAIGWKVITSFIIPWIFAEPAESAIDPKKQRRNDHRREKIIDLDEFIDCPADSRLAEGGFPVSASGSGYPSSTNDNFLYQQPVHNAEDERIYEITKQINAYSTPQAIPQYARMILQKLFVDPSVDLCSILPLNRHPSPTDYSTYESVLRLIDASSPFFDAIFDSGPELYMELWHAIRTQVDRTTVQMKHAVESVLMQAVATYVLRMLPTENLPSSSLPYHQQGPSSTLTESRLTTPLRLILPTSPYLNRVNYENSPSAVSHSHSPNSYAGHPKAVTMFCRLVTIVCWTKQFPSLVRLQLLRYCLKQFHVYCLYDANDKEQMSAKAELHLHAPFMESLYSFLKIALEQSPSYPVLFYIAQCWATYCRPWRYSDRADAMNDLLWTQFAQLNEAFYRVLLGKIHKKLVTFRIDNESIKSYRLVAEFCWKSPMCDILRNLNLDVVNSTKPVLSAVFECNIKLEQRIAEEKNKSTSIWAKVASLSETSTHPETELLKVTGQLLAEADHSIGTSFVEEKRKAMHEDKRPLSPLDGTINSTLWTDTFETPKRGYLPDHVTDPITGIMSLTPLGREQVLSGERSFDFSVCSQVLPRSFFPPAPYEFGPLARLLDALSARISSLGIVQFLADSYSSQSTMGRLSRVLMDPPIPDPTRVQSPYFRPYLQRYPPRLRLRASFQCSQVFLFKIFTEAKTLLPLFSPAVDLLASVSIPIRFKMTREEIERERKVYECETLWNMRRQFLEKHWDDVPRDQLVCDSNLFVNIYIMGCEYSPHVMERIFEMSRGIINMSSKQRKLAKASRRHTVKSKLPTIASEASDSKQSETSSADIQMEAAESSNYSDQVRPTISQNQESQIGQQVIHKTADTQGQSIAPQVKNSDRAASEQFEERLRDMKVILLEADFEASSTEMLNFATQRGKMRYDARPNALGDFEVQINGHTIFRQRFPDDCKDAQANAVNALVESFLNADSPRVKGREIWFEDDDPSVCYLRSIERSLTKSRKFMHNVQDFKDLTDALENVNLVLEKSIKHLKGWSQELELRTGGLILVKRILSKGECVADKTKQIVNDCCAKIAETILKGFKVTMASDGLLLLGEKIMSSDVLRQLTFGVKTAKRKVAPNKQNQAVKRTKEEDEEKGDAENVELINEETDEAKKEKQLKFLLRQNRIFSWGDDIPQAISSFDQVDSLPADIRQCLAQFNIDKPTPIQMQAIPAMLNDRNILACAPTGSGKTLAFAIPILNKINKLNKLKKYADGTKLFALILEPTKELAAQTYNQMLIYGGNIASCALFDSDKLPENVQILVSTPRRLLDKLDSLQTEYLRWLVVDESDRLFDTLEGEENCFRNQLAAIYRACSGKFTKRAFFSATFSHEVEKWCKETIPQLVTVCVGERNTANSHIKQELIFCGSEDGKRVTFRELLTQFEPPAIVFVQSKDRADQLAALISEYEPLLKYGVMSSERSLKERRKALNDFRTGGIWLLICTELLSRGVDVKNVNLVLNYDVPTSIVSYIHRIGRTGRAGQVGKAVTYFTEDDIPLMRPIANVVEHSGGSLPAYLLEVRKLDKRSKKRLLKSAPVRYDIAPKHAVDKIKPKRRKMKNKKDGKRGVQVDKIKKVKKIKNKTESKIEEDRN